MLSTNTVAGVRCFDDLIAYQRAVELRDAVYAMTGGTVEARDRRFRDQIRDAAASAPRNLAEGFGRFSPREFARFATIARGSITETQNHLRHGLRQRYFSQSQHDAAWNLSRRAMAATAGLIRYLKSCDADQFR